MRFSAPRIHAARAGARIGRHLRLRPVVALAAFEGRRPSGGASAGAVSIAIATAVLALSAAIAVTGFKRRTDPGDEARDRAAMRWHAPGCAAGVDKTDVGRLTVRPPERAASRQWSAIEISSPDPGDQSGQLVPADDQPRPTRILTVTDADARRQVGQLNTVRSSVSLAVATLAPDRHRTHSSVPGAPATDPRSRPAPRDARSESLHQRLPLGHR